MDHSTTHNSARVGFFGCDHVAAADDAPPNTARREVVSDLIRRYALPHATLPPWVWWPSQQQDQRAWLTMAELAAFHDMEYLEYLRDREDQTEMINVDDGDAVPHKRQRLEEEMELRPMDEDASFGLVGDARPYVGMWRTANTIVANTMEAAKWLLKPSSSHTIDDHDDVFAVALQPFGGRHHAHRDAASGFCYLNDVVVAALHLRQHFALRHQRVLIIDLDAHHGDGTQEAFFFDARVAAMSVHGYDVGIFPGTGGVDERGGGVGRGTTYNVPLPPGATDALFVPHVRRVLRELLCYDDDDARAMKENSFGAIILVCGSDGLQGDPLGNLNYSIAGMQMIVRELLVVAATRKMKVLILGAGGYVEASTARLWAVVAKDVVSCVRAVRDGGSITDVFAHEDDEMDAYVPDDCAYFDLYAPTYTMAELPPARVAKVAELPHDWPRLELSDDDDDDDGDDD